MPIKLSCPNCRTAFTFADELRGSTVRCNSCRATFVVSAKVARGEPPEVFPVDNRHRLQERPRSVAVPAQSRRADPPVARPRPPQRSGRGPLLVILAAGAVAALLMLFLGLGIAGWFALRSGSAATAAIPGGTTTVDLAAMPDVPPLRYRWRGAPHTYQVRVEVDHGNYFEDHVGNCTFNVSPANRRPANAGERQGSGTGFVVNSNGYLLTCAHVVADATKIEVTIGGAKYPAQLVAVNQGADVAIVRIAAQNLPTLSLADSDAAEVGQDVWALGYPLSDVLGNNLKAIRGTLSGVNVKNGRKTFQIDANLNPGNSGGPLVTQTGLVLGVNRAILNRAVLGENLSNVGFATPANDAKRLLTSKNVPFSADGWNAPLDGPGLVRLVSAATAFIEVTIGDRSDDQTYLITCQGQLQKSQRGKPGTNFVPPIPGFTPGSSSRVVADSTGNIRSGNGSFQMPCLLGDVAQFLIDPLPDDDGLTWEQVNQVTIEEGSGGNLGGFGLGPRGIPGMPSLPRPPGMPGLPGRQPDRQTTVRKGDERTTFRREAGAGTSVTIRKTYELKVPPAAGRSSSLTLTGNGVTAFDNKQGLPRTVQFSATLTITSGNRTETLPMTVSYKLLDKPQQAQAAPPGTPPQAPPAVAGGAEVPKPQAVKPRTPKEETPRPPTPGSHPPDTTVTLPGPASAVAVGAAGRLLILNIPSQKQLIAFDLKDARIVRSLPMAEDEVLLAASRSHLVVYLPATDRLERWNLTTFAREESVANPAGGPIKAMALGSASAGPLVVHVPGQNPPTQGIVLLDPQTFKPMADVIEPFRQPFGINVDPAQECISVSADGRAIVLRGRIHFTVLARRGDRWQSRNFRGTVPVPAPDGETIIDNGQAFSADGQALGPKRGAHWSGEWGLPALQGGLTLSLTETRQGKFDWADFRLALHVGAEAEPVVAFPYVIDAISGLVDWLPGRWPPLERHVFVLPEWGVMAVIPKQKDRIDIHRFDIDTLLKDAKRDYLFVFGQAVSAATKGTAYRSPVVVKSNKGGVKMQLVSAPPGMALSTDGVLTWTVPPDFTAPATDVALSIRDAGGKEIRHAFTIRVGEK